MEHYTDDDLIWLSGIQKFVYCPRQWGITSVEYQWADNHLTVGGNYVHRRVHDSLSYEKRKDVITSHGMPVRSYVLGVSGQCDVVEFTEDPDGIFLKKFGSAYKVMPVEYKHGRKKKDRSDLAQVAAQAMCLEEMLDCHVDDVALYYAETHSRMEYPLDQELRDFVTEAFATMHEWIKRGYVPKPEMSDKCKNCSLINICIPEMSKTKSVKKYISDKLEDI